MALIICRECGKEISDQAASCPYCGCPVGENQNVQQEEVTSVNLKAGNMKKVLAIAGVVVAVIVISAVALFANNSQNEKKKKEEFITYATTIRDNGLTGAAKCENVCNLIKKVWANTIYKDSDPETDPYTKTSQGGFYSDFNLALAALFESSDYTENVEEIKGYEESLRGSLSEMESSTEELEKCYHAAESFCKAYYDFAELASSPTGSLQTFSSTFADTDSEVMSCYKDLKYELEKLEGDGTVE